VRLERLAGPLLLAGLVALAGLVIVGWHPWPRHGLDRVRHLVDWPADCEGIETVTPFANPDTEHWTGANATGIVRCNFDGPAVGYARFPTPAARRRALQAEPPIGAACVYGRAVVLDYMDRHRDFTALCRDLDGALQFATAR
jgi:hypothetical protein